MAAMTIAPRKFHALLLAVFLQASGLATCALAQATSELAGQVLSEAGKPVAGVRIALTSVAGSAPPTTAEATTDSRGFFALNHISPGEYQLEATKAGYLSFCNASVALRPGAKTQLNVKLQPQTPPAEPAHNNAAKDADLFRVQLYEKPQLQTGRLANPSAGAGYSDSATVESSRMIHEYLQGNNAAASGAASGTGLPADCSSTVQASPASLRAASDYQNRGMQLLACKQFQTAANLFSEGLQRYPQSGSLQVGLGIALFSTGRFDDAVRALIAASDRDPGSPTPYLFLARAYRLSRTEAPEAVARLERFSTLQPHNPTALYNYATALWKSGARSPSTTTHVEILLKQVIQLSPSDARAHLQLGEVFALQSRLQEAIHEFEQATQLQPSLAEAHYQLALAYSRSGQKERGAKEMALYEQMHASEPAR